MATKLIPLSEIPTTTARRRESDARRRFASRDDALQAAEYRLVVAPGCHSRPYFDPPVIGWVCTEAAASAYAAQQTHMPGGSCHQRAQAVPRSVALYSRAATIVRSMTEPQWAAACAGVSQRQSSAQTWRTTRDACAELLDRLALRETVRAHRATLTAVGAELRGAP